MKVLNEKVISMLLLVCFFTTLIFNSVLAGQTIPGTGNDELNTKLGEIIGILFWIATAVCVGKLIHIGILFMMTGAGTKSNAKDAVLPWLIGAIICGGFATIGNLVIGIFSEGFSGGILDI